MYMSFLYVYVACNRERLMFSEIEAAAHSQTVVA